MTRIISIQNAKGGVGKTTSAINIAAALGIMGHKTLVVDLDGLCNLTTAMTGKLPERNVLTAIEQGLPLEEVAIPTTSENVDCVPGSPQLGELAIRMESSPRRYRLLENLFNTDAINNYQFIILDTSISKNCLLGTAILTSDQFLVPLGASTYSKDGLRDVFTHAYEVKPDAVCLGCCIVNFHNVPNQRLMADQIRKITETVNIRLLGDPVPFSRYIESSAQAARSIFALTGCKEGIFTNPTAAAYFKIASEVAQHAIGSRRGRRELAQAAHQSFFAALDEFQVQADFSL